ncbi:uncharacterized protein METZ01_LOCUS426290, partial [marine metagenome]
MDPTRSEQPEKIEGITEGAVSMKTDPKSKKMRQDRYDELKMILEEHRLAIVGE